VDIVTRSPAVDQRKATVDLADGRMHLQTDSVSGGRFNEFTFGSDGKLHIYQSCQGK